MTTRLKEAYVLKDDLPLLDEMHCLLANGEVSNLWAATGKVVDRAKGMRNGRNIRGRLYKRYEEVHGNAQKFRSYVEADHPLIDEIHRLLTEGKVRSLWQAALVVLSGDQDEKRKHSKHHTLYVHYRAAYPDYQRLMAMPTTMPLWSRRCTAILYAGKAPNVWAEP